MTYTEDDLTEGLIKTYQDRDFIEIIEPEAHYDHYGHRGFPDLFAVFRRPADELVEYHLIEVKSDHAIKAATGANDIIRQFNQMRRYFFKDDDRPVFPFRPEYEVVLVFELAFILSEYSVLHFWDNKELYKEAITADYPNPHEQVPPDQDAEIHNEIEVALNFRHPTNPKRVYTPVSDSNVNFNADEDPLEFYEYMKKWLGVE